MKLIDAQFMETAFYGSRQMARHLRNQGYCVGRKPVRRLMVKMGLLAVYQMPRTTVPHPEHLKYPYLLRNLVIERPSQDRSRGYHLHPDAAGVPLPRGDHGLGNAADAGLAAVEHDRRRILYRDAGAGTGPPWPARDLYTDQGSQFTSPRFTKVLLAAAVKISMKGRGRRMYNVMIELLWRSLTYECVYLHAFETGSAARVGIGKWINFYNTGRLH